MEIESEKDINHGLIDVGSSFSLYPQNNEEEAEFII
jgi:hypothetical protein